MTSFYPSIKSVWLQLIMASMLTLAATASFSAEKTKELNWDDLVPKDWNPNSVFEHLSDEEFMALTEDEYFALREEAQKILDTAPTVDSLHGKMVRIPGYLLPLEFKETKIKEFLLVPYFGACMHTPPPPANQIIHGKLRSEFALTELYEPVWISGKLSAIRSQKQLGESGISQTIDVDTGYTMEVDEIAPYEEPEQ